MRPLRLTHVVPLTLAAALAFAAPAAVQAQGFSVALKAGSTGVGGDLGIALTSRLGLRAGVGVLPFSFESDFDGDPFSITPPQLFGIGAVDLTLIGPLRLTAGLLYRSDDIVFDAEFSGGREIGDEFYEEGGRLDGAVTSSTVAPFVGIGLGRAIGRGVGIFTEFGVAFTGDPGVEVTASGPITSEPGFNTELERERASIEQDIRDVYRYWPMLNIGLRIGFGG